MIACFAAPQIGLVVERKRCARLADVPLALATDQGTIAVTCDLAGAKGVKPSMSVTAARALCPQIVVLPYSADTYRDAAEAIWDLIAEETNDVEPVSPELCYAEFTGLDAMRHICALMDNIERQTGIPLCVGVASSKLVARYSAHGNELLVLVRPGQEAEALAAMPLKYLPGMSDNLLERFQRLGLRTVRNLQNTPASELTRQFGRQESRRLQRLATGVDDDRVMASWPPLRIESHVRFDDPCYHMPTLELAVGHCCSRAAAELGQHRYGRLVGVTIVLEEGTYVREREKLAFPTHDQDALERCGKRLLSRLRVHHGITSVTLTVSDIDAGSGRQLTLLDENGNAGFAHEREQALASTINYLRRRHGAEKVTPANLHLPAGTIGGYSATLMKRCAVAVAVTTAADGKPLSWRKMRGRSTQTEYAVTRVVDSWRLGDWWQGTPFAHCYRVETWPSGIYDLERQGDRWQLRAIAD